MSETIPKPWIRKYFTEIAETFGARFFDAPESKKGQKVQIIEFLTYPDGPEDVVWAIVSDKHTFVSVKFTSEAMKQYNSVDILTKISNKRLTSRKGCIATLKNFHPFFGRIPRKNMKDLSEVEHLALAIGFVHVIGAEQEGIFGSPKDIERDEDIALWVSGLREGGGGGNILQQKKSETGAQFLQEQNNAPKQLDSSRPKPSHASPSIKPNNDELHLAEGTSKKNLKTYAEKNEKNQVRIENTKSVLETWKNSWKHIGRAPLKYAFMPVEAEHALLNILVFGKDIGPSKIMTESENSPLHVTSPRIFVDHEEQEHDSAGTPRMNREEELRPCTQQSLRQTTPTEWGASEFGEDLRSDQSHNSGKFAEEDHETTTSFPDRDGHNYGLSRSNRSLSITESTIAKNNGTHKHSLSAADTAPRDYLGTQIQCSPIFASTFPSIISPGAQSAHSGTHIEQVLTFLQGQPEQITQQSSLSILPDSSMPESSRSSIPEASFTKNKSLHSGSNNGILSQVPKIFSPTSNTHFLKPCEESQDDQRPARILVPDSDISGSASQEHAASLSQSLLPPRDTEIPTESIENKIEASKIDESQTQSETQSSSGLDHYHLKVEKDIEFHEQRQKLQISSTPYTTKPIEIQSKLSPRLGYNLDSTSTPIDEKKLLSKEIESLVRLRTLDIDDIQVYTKLERSKAGKDAESLSDPYQNFTPDMLHTNEASNVVGSVVVGISRLSGAIKVSSTIRTEGEVKGMALGANVDSLILKSSNMVNSTDISQSSDAVKVPISVPNSELEGRHERGIDNFIQHDPASWKAPSFLGRKRKSTMTQAEVIRSIENSALVSQPNTTSLVDDESRRTKKAKMTHSEHRATEFTKSAPKKFKPIVTLPKPHIMTTIHSLPSLNTVNDTLPKLNGFVINLDMLRSDDGPPWLTWLSTADILLKVGRNRYQESKLS